MSYRVSDELGLGVRLDFTTMSSNDVRNAMHKVFNDNSYYERIKHYSDLSKKTSGHATAAKLIYDCLNDMN